MLRNTGAKQFQLIYLDDQLGLETDIILEYRGRKDERVVKLKKSPIVETSI